MGGAGFDILWTNPRNEETMRDGRPLSDKDGPFQLAGVLRHVREILPRKA